MGRFGSPDESRKETTNEHPNPLRAHFRAHKLPAVTVDSMYLCKFCNGWHAVTHLRPPSGSSSGTSTREQTGRTKP